MTTTRADDQGPRRWPDDVKRDCGERPAFTGGPMPAGEDPPLEGELECVCGAPEGLHRVDGGCELTGCSWFVEQNEHEEETRPDVRIEYDAGQEPR